MRWLKNNKKKQKKNEDQNIKTSKKVKEKGKGTGKGKATGKGKEKVKRRVLQERNSSESDAENDLEWYCLICCDSYSNSRPREEWVECVMCKNWAHLQCLDKDNVTTYVCPNCDSDEEPMDD